MRRLHAAWANLPLRGKGLVVVAVPLLALSVSVFSLYAAERDASRAQAAVRRVLFLRHQIRTVEVKLLDAENGIHRYVLARRKRFQEPFSAAFVALPVAIARLQNVVGDDPSQLLRARRISALTGKKLELLAELREAYTAPDGSGSAERKRLLGRSNALMNDLRAEIAGMSAEEERRLDNRIAQVAAAQDRQRLATQGALGIGLAGGLVVALLFTTGIVRRVRRLSDNAHRLVEEQALLPLPPGDDEIGRLGRALGATGSLLLEREHKLMEAKEEAERANQAKSEFLSRTSHELRTPLNATLGFAQLLGMGDLGPEERKSVHQILRAGKHLLELIDEVLDIARIEAGGLTIVPVTVRVGDAVREAVDLVRPLAAEQNVRLESRLEAAEEHFVQADLQRLKQVLLNLLSNAIKYNHPGGLVTITSAEAPAGRLRINIEDTGLGMEEDQLERLFMPFERVGAETSAVEGTGLGLALSKRLVELMGGAIGVSSEPGMGTNFWVDLPLAPLPSHERPRVPHLEPLPVKRPDRPFTVLYIEDNASSLELVEQILEYRPGIELLHAALGSAGVELARVHDPDLILLDIRLPDMAGEDVLAQLSARSRARVVVLTADATAPSMRRVMGAGAQRYLTKPLDVRRFLEIVDDALELAR